MARLLTLDLHAIERIDDELAPPEAKANIDALHLPLGEETVKSDLPPLRFYFRLHAERAYLQVPHHTPPDTIMRLVQGAPKGALASH